jgi:hypothetical protein
MGHLLREVQDNGYYGGMVPVRGLVESWRPQDMARYERTKWLLQSGLYGAALREHDLRRGLREAMVTDDLPIMLAGNVDLHVREGYGAVTQNWRQCFKETSFSNFRQQTIAKLSDLLTDDEAAGGASRDGILPEVPEGMNYDEARMSEEYEYGQVKTYGATFSMTRQMLINDDQRSLSIVPQAMGAAAARTINFKVAYLLENNGTLVDGHELFDATDHGNYTAGGTALSLTNLEAEAVKFVSQATSPGGRTIRVLPRYLIIPPELEITARTILGDAATQLMATALGSTSAAALRGTGNPLNNLIEVVVLEELTDANDWYLAAAKDPLTPTVEVAFLNGQSSPELFVQQAPDLASADGVKHKVRQDFGAYAADYRYIRKVTGA